jgi:hypothetical protein
MPSACQPGLAFGEPDDGLQRVPSNCVAPELNISGARKLDRPPSRTLAANYAAQQWRRSDTHYERIAFDWLGNFDSHRDEMRRRPSQCLWQRQHVWMRRWRWCFLATAGLSDYAGGSESASAITE